MDKYISALSKLKVSFSFFHSGLAVLIAIATCLSVSVPALAHHPLGGETPNTLVEGFLSGIGHPVIGLDHFAFIIASGLIAAAMGRRFVVPIAFVAASLFGTGIHLMSIDLPVPELVIAASVLVFGILLSLKDQPGGFTVPGLAAIAGMFHGFAYGEAIFGAEMGPLVAYLSGFAFIQLAIAATAYWLGSTIFKRAGKSGLSLRFAGFVICGIGGTFLTTFIMDSIFPA